MKRLPLLYFYRIYIHILKIHSVYLFIGLKISLSIIIYSLRDVSLNKGWIFWNINLTACNLPMLLYLLQGVVSSSYNLISRCNIFGNLSFARENAYLHAARNNMLLFQQLMQQVSRRRHNKIRYDRFVLVYPIGYQKVQRLANLIRITTLNCCTLSSVIRYSNQFYKQAAFD